MNIADPNDDELTAESEAKRKLTAWLEYRRNNPLPPPTGLKADKEFYDSLYEDEPGDGQFQFTDLA